MDQGTEEWHAARLGKVTASKVADLIVKKAGRDNYLAQLVCERLTGKKTEGYSNGDMEWGIETEKFARAAYEIKKGVMVEEVGFVGHPTIEMSGASPDGFVQDGKQIGLIEIKCPKTATHLDYLMTGIVPGKYITQMQWQMCCTGTNWCDFLSFDPRLPENLQMFIKRIPYDPIYVAMLEKEVIQFLGDLDEMIVKLEKI